MFEVKLRHSVVVLAAVAAGVFGAAPRDAEATFFVGPASACVIRAGSCPADNLFDVSSTSNLTAPGVPDAAANDFIGNAPLDASGAYQADFDNNITDTTVFDLILRPASFFSVTGPLTWFFNLPAAPGGETIVAISEIAGGPGGIAVDAVDFNLGAGSLFDFSVSTSFAPVTSIISVRLRIDTAPPTPNVALPGVLTLMLAGVGVLAAGAHRRR